MEVTSVDGKQWKSSHPWTKYNGQIIKCDVSQKGNFEAWCMVMESDDSFFFFLPGIDQKLMSYYYALPAAVAAAVAGRDSNNGVSE